MNSLSGPHHSGGLSAEDVPPGSRCPQSHPPSTVGPTHPASPGAALCVVPRGPAWLGLRQGELQGPLRQAGARLHVPGMQMHWNSPI